MTIYETIKVKLNEARKAKISFVVTSLSTILGEIQRVDPKNPSDNVVISALKKTVSNLKELPSNEAVDREITLLSSFIPEQLDEKALTDIFFNAAHNGNTLGDWMKYLKEKYSGLYDGKVASSVFKNNS